CAAAALCAGGEDHATSPSDPRAAPGRVRHAGGRPAGAGGLRLADQHGLYRAHQPVDAPACGRYWTARHHAVQTRGRRTPAVGVVSRVLQLLLAPCQPTRAVATAPADQRDGFSQDVAAADPSDGRGADGSGVDPPGGADVSRAAVATARGGVRAPW